MSKFIDQHPLKFEEYLTVNDVSDNFTGRKVVKSYALTIELIHEIRDLLQGIACTMPNPERLNNAITWLSYIASYYPDMEALIEERDNLDERASALQHKVDVLSHKLENAKPLRWSLFKGWHKVKDESSK